MFSCRNWQSGTKSAWKAMTHLLKDNRVHRSHAMRHSFVCSLSEISSVNSLFVGASGAELNMKETWGFNEDFAQLVSSDTCNHYASLHAASEARSLSADTATPWKQWCVLVCAWMCIKHILTWDEKSQIRRFISLPIVRSGKVPTAQLGAGSLPLQLFS